MAKLTTQQIRERAVELLRENHAAMRTGDLVLAIAAEHPEANLNTVRTEVHRLPRHLPNLVTRLDRGLMALVPLAGRLDLGETFTRTTERRLPNSVDALAVLGFTKVGVWRFSGKELAFRVQPTPFRGPMLYAFAVGREVVYLGRSTQALTSRLCDYQTPQPLLRANVRVRKLIEETLGQDRAVEIYVLDSFGESEYRGIPYDIATALEGPLIDRMRPAWNRTA